MEISTPWCRVTLIIIIKCSSYCGCVTDCLTSQRHKAMIYYAHGFCGSGFWTAHDRDSLSLLRNTWDLKLEDSKAEGRNYLKLSLFTCLEDEALWRLTLVGAVEQDLLNLAMPYCLGFFTTGWLDHRVNIPRESIRWKHIIFYHLCSEVTQYPSNILCIDAETKPHWVQGKVGRNLPLDETSNILERIQKYC